MEKRNDRKRSVRVQRSLHGKRGFTLAELLVTMGLLALLTAMIVTFSVLMGEYAGKSSEDSDRIGECFEIKEAITAYVVANDVYEEGKTVDLTKIKFDDDTDTLTVNGKAVESLKSVKKIGISIHQSGKLVKFTLTFHAPEEEEAHEPFVFAIAVRYAIPEGGDAS